MTVLGEILFYNPHGPCLDDVLRHQSTEGLRQAADRLQASAFDKTDDEIAEELAQQEALEPLQVDFAKAKPDVRETTVDVSSSFDYGFPSGGHAPGLSVTKTIPFSGDPQLWQLRTNPFDLNPPRGTVRGNSVVIGIEVPASQGDSAAGYLDSTISQIKTCLQRQEAQIAAHNASLKQQAVAYVRDRRSRVGAAADLLKKLGG